MVHVAGRCFNMVRRFAVWIVGSRALRRNADTQETAESASPACVAPIAESGQDQSVQWVPWSVPMYAESEESNCDRVNVRVESCAGRLVVMVAIADGVSQSFRPAPWADALVHRVEIRHLDGDDPEVFAELSRSIGMPEAHELPWNQAVLRERGSQSTLLLVGATESEEGWHIEFRSVGDCLLVLEFIDLDGARLTMVWPVTTPEDLDSVPGRIGTESPYLLGEVQRHALLVTRPIRALVMTDAVARFVINAVSRSTPGDVWGIVPLGLRASNEEYVDWINQLRRDKSIADDDSTVALVEWCQ